VAASASFSAGGCVAGLSRVADSPIKVICAGRTDRGVHARGQVIHFDTAVVRTEYAWLCGTNANLPPDIVITWVKIMTEDFHARFSAQARRYQYTIYNAAVRPVLNAYLLTWHKAK
jgi:tRNA pseudouridine38-40 synthase